MSVKILKVLKLNLNDTVRVKLTPRGRAIHRKNWERLACSIGGRWGRLHQYMPPAEDGGGWSQWPLWILMQEFGSEINLGCDLPLETEMEVVVEP